MTASVKLPIKRGERAYQSFLRHLQPDDEMSRPAPMQPAQRVTRDATQALHDMLDRLVAINVDVLAHLPDAVRLKLSRLILAAAESVEHTHDALATYARHGTLTPPGYRPQQKRRVKPR